MVQRHENDGNKHKVENQVQDYETFSTPKIVAEPKTERAKKIIENKTARDSTETNLEKEYLDPIRGNKQRRILRPALSPRDLAVIISPNLYKDVESKPDRMNNRAVDYMIPHLELLNTLLANFSEHYKNKIWHSLQFRTLFETYLGTAEYNKKKLSKEEKKARLKDANQWLIDSLTIIEDSLPLGFKQLLKDTGKPYFKLIQALADNEGIKEIKITDRMIR